MFFSSLLNFGLRQEHADHLEVAASIYSLVQSHGDTASIRDQAGARLDAVLGRGATGPRVEFLARRFSREVTSPTALFAMGTAGAVFKVARLATLSRLVANPSLGILSRGMGARAAAGLAGFMVEAPTFTFAGRFAGEVMGVQQDWTGGAVGRDLASSFLVLGGLKLAGGASAVTARQIGQISSVGARSANVSWRMPHGVAARVLPQVGMFAGISLGHQLEQAAGIRPHQDGATNAVDSIALLLQFNMMGRLNRAAFGEGFHQWERGLELQAERLASQDPVRRWQFNFLSPGQRLAEATAVGGRAVPHRPEGIDRSHIQMMANQGEGNGDKPVAGEGFIPPASEARPQPEESARVEEISAQQELQIILESTPDGVVTINQWGVIIKANRAMERIFGFNPEQLIGRALTRVINIHYQDLPRATGIELSANHRDGRQLAIQLSLGEYRIGDKLFMTGIIRDLTEQKQQEAELARLLTEMESTGGEVEPPRSEEGSGPRPLSMKTTSDIAKDLGHPRSRLLQRLLEGNVEIHLSGSGTRILKNFAGPFRGALNLKTARMNLPNEERTITVLLTGNETRSESSLVLVKRPSGFEILSEPVESSEPSPAPATEPPPDIVASTAETLRTPVPAEAPTEVLPASPEPASGAPLSPEAPSTHLELLRIKRQITAELVHPDKIEAGVITIPITGRYTQASMNKNTREIINYLDDLTSGLDFPMAARIALVYQGDRGQGRTVFIRGKDGFTKFTSRRKT